MHQYGAYCGLDCDTCEARLAHAANDLAKLEEMARKTREEWGVPDATAESVRCVGCFGNPPDPLIGYCFECGIRACARDKGVPTCAECPDYACDRLAEFFACAPEVKANLEARRRG